MRPSLVSLARSGAGSWGKSWGGEGYGFIAIESGNIKPREIVEGAIVICNLFINSYAIIRHFLK